MRRTASHGIGVERTFLYHSPRVEKVEVTREAASGVSKLYYLRNLRGKAARLKEKRSAVACGLLHRTIGDGRRRFLRLFSCLAGGRRCSAD